MTMSRFTFVVLASSLWLSAALSAQQPSYGPIRASLMEEATRRAWALPVGEQPRDGAVGVEISPAQQNAPPTLAADPLDSQWTRVRQLAVGTVIFAKVQGSPTAKRRFMSADASALTVREASDGAQAIETLARVDIVEVRAPKARSIARKVAWGITGYVLGGDGRRHDLRYCVRPGGSHCGVPWSRHRHVCGCSWWLPSTLRGHLCPVSWIGSGIMTWQCARKAAKRVL